jgi:porphobilinogen synthase
MIFPVTRMRRLRRTPTLRRMVAETRMSVDNLIYPMFVCPEKDVAEQVGSMPGVFRYSVDRMVQECKEVWNLGVPAVLLFGIPEHKDAMGSESAIDDGMVQQAVRAIKDAVPELAVITDVCMCEYTDHGHCGVIIDGDVANDPTLDLLAAEAVSHAKAGADMVAPSDMMDGRVAHIRNHLDTAGFPQTPIMSYAAKFASAYYGPFREAADSTPQFGDRRSYQMDPPNAREALREIEIDIQEGADIVMVKPGIAYLDILNEAAVLYDVPMAVYQVSGEYSMIKAAGEKGWIDEERVMMETLLAFVRAGAQMILTYFAKDAAKVLQK